MGRGMRGRLLFTGLLAVACGGSTSGGGAHGSASIAFRFMGVDKIDLLLVIDNSTSMADKQQILSRAVPPLVERLGAVLPEGGDIHVGVITSSLGGHGSAICANKDDHARLIGTSPGFLDWETGAGSNPPTTALRDAVANLGESGCGFEAPLEAWYRFLVDPNPPDTVVKNAKTGNTEGQGTDNELLAERINFLRPDSLVAIVMLTDENDCSVADVGLGWLVGYDQNNLPTPTSICATDPDNKCCHSCGQGDPQGCTHDPICDTQPNLPADQDQVNLRCWDQKRRFGIASDPSHPGSGLLYPTQRYSNALKQTIICPNHLDLACADGEAGVANPLYSDLEYTGVTPRGPDLVFIAGIVGVPWQDIATDDTRDAPDALAYMTSDQLTAAGRWDVILGDPAEHVPPIDPLMQESVDPRSGKNPVTDDPVAPPGSSPTANPINGHDWSIPDRDDLQYACIFPLPVPRDCSDPSSACDCSAGQAADKPLCQDPQTGQVAATPTQFYAKAYPGLRELEVLKEYGGNAFAASICPKILDTGNPDYGYAPAFDAIVGRLSANDSACTGRVLPANPTTGMLSCTLVEALDPARAQGLDCNRAGRHALDGAARDAVLKRAGRRRRRHAAVRRRPARPGQRVPRADRPARGRERLLLPRRQRRRATLRQSGVARRLRVAPRAAALRRQAAARERRDVSVLLPRVSQLEPHLQRHRAHAVRDLPHDDEPEARVQVHGGVRLAHAEHDRRIARTRGRDEIRQHRGSHAAAARAGCDGDRELRHARVAELHRMRAVGVRQPQPRRADRRASLLGDHAQIAGALPAGDVARQVRVGLRARDGRGVVRVHARGVGEHLPQERRIGSASGAKCENHAGRAGISRDGSCRSGAESRGGIDEREAGRRGEGLGVQAG